MRRAIRWSTAWCPLFAAISYFAMAIHQGAITLSSGREFLFARYIDWSVTTPALLLGLSMTALHGAHRRAALVAGLLVSDVVMIVTGLFFGASQDPFAKWVWVHRKLRRLPGCPVRPIRTLAGGGHGAGPNAGERL